MLDTLAMECGPDLDKSKKEK